MTCNVTFPSGVDLETCFFCTLQTIKVPTMDARNYVHLETRNTIMKISITCASPLPTKMASLKTHCFFRFHVVVKGQ